MIHRIVGKDVAIGERSKQRFERRLEFALGRFGSSIRSVDLTLEDENGPRGGVDKSCRIVVKMLQGRYALLGNNTCQTTDWPETY